MSDLFHDLVGAVKQLALSLGRTPTRMEFANSMTGGDYKIRTVGGYQVIVNAAGLDPVSTSKKKITNDIFAKNIESHLAEYQPRKLEAKTSWPKIAVLGDLHEPFGHAGVKSAFIEFCRNHQPEWIVQVGDAVDFLSHSKFPRSHNTFTPKEEEDQAIKALSKLWAELAEACPNAKRVMLLGNHGIRPLKRVLESVPSIEHWAEKYLKELLTFPGVETVMDPREEYMIADIAFIHGYKSGIGSHRDHLMTNVVAGHIHVGGVSMRSFRGRTLWELNAGLAGDPDSKGLTYTSTKTTGWTLGFGWIDEFGPRFIPFA